ncbi:hypothetical protein HK104_004947, partial [Borealophlyctis nickersoniae]
MAPITVKIKCSNESAFSVTIEPTATVAELKAEIVKVSPGEAGSTPPRLIFSGKVLKDDEVLSTYKVAEGNTRETATSAQSTPNTSSSNTSPSNAPSQAGAGVNPFGFLGGLGGANAAAGGGAPPMNPFAALAGLGAGGAAGAGGAGAGGFGGNAMPFGAGMDPNLMSQLLQNPAVAASVSQMFSNPQFLDAMIASNPRLAGMMTPELRQMMQSDE